MNSVAVIVDEVDVSAAKNAPSRGGPSVELSAANRGLIVY